MWPPKTPRVVVLAVVLVGMAGSASAQQGVTLQLPTFSFFSVATSVVVPDRGGAYLGGVGRVGSGATRFGPGRSGQAFGFERHAASMHVSAHIHDLREMDEALLRGAPDLSAAGSSSPARPNDPAAVLSLKEIDSKRARELRATQAQAEDFFARGRAAQAAGKGSLAKTYYQMALRRASGELQTQIAAELERFNDRASAARLAERP